jgi:hypothetical protein
MSNFIMALCCLQCGANLVEGIAIATMTTSDTVFTGESKQIKYPVMECPNKCESKTIFQVQP